jgi:hypothetical protein
MTAPRLFFSRPLREDPTAFPSETITGAAIAADVD